MRQALVKNLPNALTLSRLFLCPVIILSLLKGKNAAGLELLALACLTDFLDGYLARKLGAVSSSGELLDPICDKIFALSLFSLLMTAGACPPWFLGLLISVAVFQCLGLAFLKLNKPAAPFSFGSLRLGKWNMALQFFWILLLTVDVFVIHRGEEPGIFILITRNVAYCTLAALQLAVFLRYFFRFHHWLAPLFRTLAPLH